MLGGKLDRDSVRPFITDTNAAQGFGHLFFREPRHWSWMCAATWLILPRFSATGRVVATDFAMRGQWVDSLITTLGYTNRTVEFYLSAAHAPTVRNGSLPNG